MRKWAIICDPNDLNFMGSFTGWPENFRGPQVGSGLQIVKASSATITTLAACGSVGIIPVITLLLRIVEKQTVPVSGACICTWFRQETISATAATGNMTHRWNTSRPQKSALSSVFHFLQCPQEYITAIYCPECRGVDFRCVHWIFRFA
jgi:hypothetical protein